MTAFVVALDADDRRHLSRALEAHARWCRANGQQVPLALLQMQKLASNGQRRPEIAVVDEPLHDDDMTPMPLLVDYAEAARRLDVSERSLRRLVATGVLPVVEVGGARRIAVTDLAEFVEHQRAEAINRRVTI